MALVDQGGGPGDCLRRRPARVCGVDQVKTIEELFAEFVCAQFIATASGGGGGYLPYFAPELDTTGFLCNHTSLLTGETTILNGTCALCGQRGL